MKLLYLAWRNVHRNRRRSANTIIAITVGLAALIFVWGFIDGMNEQTIENRTTYLTGHLKIHKKGFHENKALYLSMPYDIKLQNRLSRITHIEAVTPRIEDKAMLSGEKEARGVKVIGIDPVQEPKVTTIAKSIIAGRYLALDDENTILLGDNLAERTGLKIGNQAVLVSQARDGSLAADRYRVVGLYNSGIDLIDATHVFITLNSAQELYSLWGQITEWAVRIDERKFADRVAAGLQNEIDIDYEVLTWEQLLPETVQMVRFHEVITYIVVFIVIVVVAVGIANTILMAVMERTREFGIMLALGTSQGQIIQLVLLESFLLGLTGLILGGFFGLGITAFYGSVGIDLTEYTLAMETMPGLSGSVYPMIRWDHVLLVSVVTIFISILPAFYPAWRVSRLQPVEAIHGVLHKTQSKFNFTRNKLVIRIRKCNLMSFFQFKKFSFFRIALRSILRNSKRSVLTSAATAFGLGAFLFLYAFTDGFFEQMINNSIDFSTSHVQIEPNGFREQLSPAMFLLQSERLIQVIKNNPDVIEATPRIQIEAMISSPSKTEPLILTGVNADSEAKVTRIHSVITEGQYLNNSARQSILLGAKLASELDVNLGEKVVVTAQLADGSLGSAAYRLVGIYQTDNDIFDRSLGFIGLQQAQKLLNMENKVSTIAIRLNQRQLSSQYVNEFNIKFASIDFQANSWQDIMPVLVQMIDMTRLMFFVVLVIVFIVVAIGVMNTLFMSVLERTREFGVMLALGTEPSLIVRLIVYESIILGFIGILIGILIGIFLVAFYSDEGMNLSGFAGATDSIPGLTDVIYPILIFEHLWLPTLLLFISGVFASFYPAFRAAQLAPVIAIRHV